ncbi:MAG: hypothetical protein ACKOOD_03060 [Microbacteriaceae bacterium]
MVEFVGFAQSPQIPEGSERLVYGLEYASTQSIDDAAKLIVGRDTAEQWLGEVSKFQLQPGGKIVGAERTLTVTELNLPKSVTLIADAFGEGRLTIEKRADGCLVTLTFVRWALPSEFDEFWSVTRAYCSKLERLLEVNDGKR